MGPLRVGIDYRPALLGSVGIARYVRELCRALAPLPGLDLRLYGHSIARCRRRDPIPAGARLHRAPIPGRSLPWLRRFGRGAELLCGGPTVFHWTDYVHPPVSARTHVVLTLHDVAFVEESYHGPAQAAWLSSRTREALTRAELVICPSTATATAAERMLSVPGDRLRVVPLGADHVPATRPPHPRGKRPFLVAVGTIEPRKNHARLLDAWQRLARPRPTLVVLGKLGWESAATAAALRRAAATDDVVWLDRADDATVLAHVAHAEALVYPSLLEGFGLPPLEALALGTPVVAGDTPALREVLGDAARFCDPRDTEAIADAIRTTLAAPDARTRAAREGPRRAAAFTWRRCAERHAEIYREAGA